MTATDVGSLRKRVPLGPLTSYRCGGEAEYFARAEDAAELTDLLRFAAERSLPVRVLGRGTNVLVSDAGVDGLVLSLGEGFRRIEHDGGLVKAGAGVSMGMLVRFAVTNGLGGLAPLAGIPGTLGGALAGNAGSGGVEIGALVKRVTVVSPEGEVRELSAGECGFGYRRSSLGGVVVSALLRLRPSDAETEAASARAAVLDRRRFPRGRTAGSVFKNPPGCSAAALLDAAGLKGASVGGAVVSNRHANFIICRSESADDVARLMAVCRRAVFERFGVLLEPEIRLWGFPPDILEVKA